MAEKTEKKTRERDPLQKFASDFARTKREVIELEARREAAQRKLVDIDGQLSAAKRAHADALKALTEAC